MVSVALFAERFVAIQHACVKRSETPAM